MSDLVENPEDWFSRITAHVISRNYVYVNQISIGSVYKLYMCQMHGKNQTSRISNKYSMILHCRLDELNYIFVVKGFYIMNGIFSAIFIFPLHSMIRTVFSNIHFSSTFYD